MWLIGMIAMFAVIGGFVYGIPQMRQPWSGLTAIVFMSALIALAVYTYH